jgi:hypothetical protein
MSWFETSGALGGRKAHGNYEPGPSSDDVRALKIGEREHTLVLECAKYCVGSSSTAFSQLRGSDPDAKQEAEGFALLRRSNCARYQVR